MTAVTKASLSILAATSVAPGSTKASPGAGAWVDVNGYNGGVLGGRITNGSSAPAVQGQMTWQWTPDPNVNPVKIYDLWTFGGDTVAGSTATASIRLDKEVKFVRAACYGNTTNPVTFESDLAASS
jgi:hypothetical protein